MVGFLVASLSNNVSKNCCTWFLGFTSCCQVASLPAYCGGGGGSITNLMWTDKKWNRFIHRSIHLSTKKIPSTDSNWFFLSTCQADLNFLRGSLSHKLSSFDWIMFWGQCEYMLYDTGMSQIVQVPNFQVW